MFEIMFLFTIMIFLVITLAWYLMEMSEIDRRHEIRMRINQRRLESVIRKSSTVKPSRILPPRF